MKHQDLDIIFEDIFVYDIMTLFLRRFLLNLPSEEINSPQRLGFQIEQAYWYYLDFIIQKHSKLPRYDFENFGLKLLSYNRYVVNFLQYNVDDLSYFRKYKQRVPTCGAILINYGRNKLLLVKGFNSNLWGFPKGKISKDESPVNCAIREVFEETSFDCSLLIDSQKYIETRNFEQFTRLFLIYNVQEDFPFIPKTRREIKDIKWFYIDELPHVNINIDTATLLDRILND